MPLRILVGPIHGLLDEVSLIAARDSGIGGTFGPDGVIHRHEDTSTIDRAEEAPADGLADFVAWWMPGGLLPEPMWRVSVPVIAIAANWREQWHLHRAVLGYCAAVFSDPAGTNAFRQAGFSGIHEIEPNALNDSAALTDWDPGSMLLNANWQEITAGVERHWPAISQQARSPVDYRSRPWLLVRSLAVVDRGVDAALATDLATALMQHPNDAALHHALGVITFAANPKSGVAAATASFQRAWASDPSHVVAGLNLVEALMTQRREDEAKAVAVQLQRALNAPPPLSADISLAPRYPIGFEAFRNAWERSGWQHAGEPGVEDQTKRALIRGRVHTYLATLTGDLVHYHEAVLAQPDEPTPRAALGCALARAGRIDDALPHLQKAVDVNPADRIAARALFQLYGDLGQKTCQRRLARERRRQSERSPDQVPMEGWFAEVAPPGDELASILLVCWNGRAITQSCLESVLANTRRPFELIVVDNGSTDGTADFIGQLMRSKTGAERIEVITNAQNRGYPAAMNQALGAARGEYLVMLNNDTLVPPTWLDHLIDWLLFDWPQIGLVGPMTNYAPPPQCATATYADPVSGLASFADDHRKRLNGRYSDVSRLSGFCMLTRREVLDRVGDLDEQFGIGFFDDDDFVLRVRAAGFRAIIAHDVFVHHHGSQTFAALGIDCQKQLANNLERFRAKWGDERAAGYKMSGRSTDHGPLALEPVNEPGSSVRGPARVSLCVIAKNEESNIAECLRDWSSLFAEAVVVDTGSTDRTREIAQSLGAKVVDFPWCDSFAAARNVSLDHATGDWIFWLDADDRLDEAHRLRLRELFSQLGADNVGYSMKCVCVSELPGGSPTVVDHMRLFRNHPKIRWKYRVHEQILPAIRAASGEVRWSDIAIRHVGYQDSTLRHRKLERDLRLLNLENSEHPDDPFTLFNLGAVLLELGQPSEALPFLRRSIDRSHPSDSIVRKLYALVASAHRRLDQAPLALAACQEGRQHYPDDAELLFTEGLVHREAHRPADAEACWVRLLHAQKECGHFASVDIGLRGHKTRHNLAILYLDQQRYPEAEAQWRLTLVEEPAFNPARLGLAELYLKQQRWIEFDDVIQHLESDSTASNGGTEVAELRARSFLVRKEFAAARWSLHEAIERFPRDLGLRILFSHAWLQEGTDFKAAEQALLDVLSIDAENSEAKHNLKVLRSRHAIA